MRVVHCIPQISLGGADLGALGFVRDLSCRQGVDARLCILSSVPTYPSWNQELLEPVVMGFRGRHGRPDEYLRFRAAIRRWVLTWRPDIVHSHLWPACRWVTSALLDLPVRHVWHIHDTRSWLYDAGWRSRALRAWTRYLLRRARPRLAAVSRAAAAHSAEPLDFSATECAIVSCGVDTIRFSPRTKHRKASSVVGLAAQFRPEKGHDVLLKAVHRLRQSGQQLELHLAGEGETLRHVRNLCGDLGLTAQVRFLGHLHDIPAFLSELDLFVLPSTAFEGLPVCLLEAMAMRIPVVATALPGNMELIDHGTTGYLAQPGDPVSLAATIHLALSSDGLQQDILNRAQRLVHDRHAREVVTDKLIGLYSSLLL